MITTPPSLEARIADLERATARYRSRCARLEKLCLALGLGVVAAGTVAFGPPIPDVLQARRIEIVDERGIVVFAAKAGPKGGQMDIWSSDDQNVARLWVNEHGGDLALWNKERRNVFGAYAVDQGGRLDLYDTRHDGAVVSAATHEHGGTLAIYGAGGPQVWRATATPAGGELRVTDATGRRRLTAGVQDGGGFARVYGAGETRLVEMGASEASGGGFVEVSGATGGRVFTTAAEPDGGGRIDLADESGTVVFSVNAIADAGGALAVMNSAGTKLFLVGPRPHGGLLNLLNSRGQAVFIAGTADEGMGGALSIKNGGNRQILHAGYDSLGNGLVTVWGATGESMETISPRK